VRPGATAVISCYQLTAAALALAFGPSRFAPRAAPPPPTVCASWTQPSRARWPASSPTRLWPFPTPPSAGPGALPKSLSRLAASALAACSLAARALSSPVRLAQPRLIPVPVDRNALALALGRPRLRHDGARRLQLFAQLGLNLAVARWNRFSNSPWPFPTPPPAGPTRSSNSLSRLAASALAACSLADRALNSPCALAQPGQFLFQLTAARLRLLLGPPRFAPRRRPPPPTVCASWTQPLPCSLARFSNSPLAFPTPPPAGPRALPKSLSRLADFGACSHALWRAGCQACSRARRDRAQLLF